jgi:hypothetical protein
MARNVGVMAIVMLSIGQAGCGDDNGALIGPG